LLISVTVVLKALRVGLLKKIKIKINKKYEFNCF
jgi:hypothetical protein